VTASPRRVVNILDAAIILAGHFNQHYLSKILPFVYLVSDFALTLIRENQSLPNDFNAAKR